VSGRGATEGGLGAPTALTACLALAAFGVVGSLTHLVLPATELPPPFPSQHQDAETLAFVFSFAVALPLALLFVLRLQARLGGDGARRLEGVAASLTVALIGGVAALKVADAALSVAGAAALLAASLAWWSIAAAMIAMAWSGRGAGLLDRIAAASDLLWWLALALIAAGSLAFVDLEVLVPAPLIAGIVLAAGAVLLWRAGVGERIALGRRAGRLADAAIVVLILLAVPNIVIFDLSNPLVTHVIQFHQNFFLGPADQVINGGAMLTDTLSQYGVASIYLIAGWFELVPIGNGTLGFLDNILSALVFVAAYGVVRLAGTSRLLAAATMTVAVVSFVYGLDYPLGALLQHGSIRFGLPMVVIAAATIEFARPSLRRPAQIVQLLGIGLASIWALEAFAYTLVTAGAVLAVRVRLYPSGTRLRSLGRWSAGSLLAFVGFHIAFALATLAIAGELPDWGWYLNTLREFLTGSVGELTYDFAPWTVAFALGAFYIAAIAALVLLLVRRPALARRHPGRVVALAATAAWGVALFSYFVNRSAEHIVPYLSLPAAMTAAIWLGLLLDPAVAASRRVRTTGLAAMLAAGVLLVAVAWPRAGTLYSQSLLAHVIPGGPSLATGFDRLWHPPDLSPGASSGAALIERCIPDRDRTYVLTDADLGIEILAKADRRNGFPLADPWEDSFVPETHLEKLTAAVAGLQPGDRLLVDDHALKSFRIFRRDPSRDPLASPTGGEEIVPTGLAKLQDWLIKEIGLRYRLKTVCRTSGEQGLRVVELKSR
jgi:hypothetical protein